MAAKVAFDTTFLIDLQRERSALQRERSYGEVAGPAHRFLAAAPDLELYLSPTALGEFAEGFSDLEAPLLKTGPLPGSAATKPRAPTPPTWPGGCRYPAAPSSNCANWGRSSQ